MGVLFQSNPAAMAAIVALLGGGFFFVGLSVTPKEIKLKWLSMLAPSTLKGRAATFAFGAFSVLVAVALAVLITYQAPQPPGTDVAGTDPSSPAASSDPSESDTPTDPAEPTEPPPPEPTAEVEEASWGEPWEEEFTLRHEGGKCRNLDASGMPLSETNWNGLCILYGDLNLGVHNGALLLLWEEGGTPEPDECVDQVGRHGYPQVAVTEGDEVCVITEHNRVAVVTVISAHDGVRVNARVWGPLRD